MKKINVLQRLETAGVVAVIRGKDRTEAFRSSEAVIKGGIKGIEVTFTVPEADQLIRDLRAEYLDQKEVVIGAGTVLDAVTARLAIMAGAEYIVSPAFDQETAEICNLYQVPYLPGCMTVTEAQTALRSGVDVIKLFPGNIAGAKMISAIKAPLPFINIMPTGGVNLENMVEWVEAGAVMVGVGGSLLKPAETGDFEKITALAKEYTAKWAELH